MLRRNIDIGIWSLPVLCFFLLVICYGFFTPWLGFYGDDWPKLYNLKVLGIDGIVDSQSSDRPLWGWVFGFFFYFIGDNAFGWQLFALITRWLSVFAFWSLIRRLWPKNLVDGAAVVLLFTVYPGIMQESRGFTYGIIWLQLALSFFSLELMIRTIRANRFRVGITSLSIIFGAISWNISEYFIGFEVLRPMILWMMISNAYNGLLPKIVSTIKHWFPYALAFGSYIIWRFSVFETNRTEVDPVFFLSEILENPVAQLVERLNNVLPDILETSFLVWPGVLSYDNLSITSRSTWLAWFAALIVIIMTFFWLKGLCRKAPNSEFSKSVNRLSWPVTAVIGGLVTIIFGMSPIWFSNIHYVSGYGASRYALPAIAGSSLIMVGLFRLVVSDCRRLVVLVSIFVGIGTVAHVKSANSYRQEWSDQGYFFWQLAWRAPALQTGAVIWLNTEIWRKRHPADYTYAMPLNLIYAPDHKSPDLMYWLLPLEEQLDDLNALKQRDAVLDRRLRNLRFEGQLGKSIIVWHSPPHCLRILDSTSTIPPEVSPLLEIAAIYSKSDEVIRAYGEAGDSVSRIFGEEPEHDWCYFFQKAELASQKGNFQRVVELGDEAIQKGLTPTYTKEWLSFLQGYKALGREEEIRRLIQASPEH